CQQHNEYPWTF
nr:immunoglobulin light chain junction region [Mus musculus]NSL98592.1 immunoglobulin light chain junction region [Mus musculus]NSL99013.1 immunoglobulin light chain junction region [Mus musculus]NSL99905.1 immunoglobulin light chain junction region [Mus musculus]NSM01064.1 immunoglobulin light chain junction region [Mus musculus]